MTLAAWLKTIAPSYELRESPPVSITVNGEVIDAKRWEHFEFAPADEVEVRVEPKGAAAIFGAILAAVLAVAVSRAMAPKIPGTSTSPNAGESLAEASAKGNKIKLGEIIREIAGHQRVYPCYLTPPVRRFSAPREQWVEMLLCVGKGKYQIPTSKVKVGETPLISLGADAQFAVYNPGDNLSGQRAAQWWHSAAEVGSSANGSAGLELTLSTELTQSSPASALQLNGPNISIPVGGGAFPADWSSGLIIRLLSPYLYTVVDGGADRDIVQGDLAMLAPYVGMPIEVIGANQGFYEVHTCTPYTPAVPPVPGTASTLAGSSAPSRYDFDVTPLTFTVTRGGEPYAATLNSAATDLAGLVAAINIAKGVAPYTAVSSGGKVRLVETSPYAGQPLAVSSASAVFGVAPIGTSGTATTTGTPEQPAQMTLNFEGGSPVVGLVPGVGLATIGPRGLRYRITAYSAAMLSVERLTANGAPDESWPGFSYMETINGVIMLDPSNLQGGYRGPFACCPEGELVTEVEWDVLFPQGLCGVGREGQIYAVNAYHTFEYRDMALSGAWTVIDVQHNGGSLDAQGFTSKVVLPYAMRPEARIKQRFVHQPGRIDNEKRDDTVWYGVRGKMVGAPVRYDGMTTIAVRVRNGDRLSAQSENLVSVEATRVLPVRSGGGWVGEAPTRDIIPWFMYVAKSAGYTDADMDLAELDRLHDVFRGRGDFFDMTIDDVSTIKDALNDVLAAGFSELTVSRGLLRPVRDEPRSVFEQMYTPQNMTKALKRRIIFPSPDDFDGVDVEYVSSMTWQAETVECRWPGDLGLKVEKIKIPGVSNRDKAYQIGMRRRGHQKFRGDSFSWETELDALNSNYLSYVAAADDIPGYGQSSILMTMTPGAGSVVLESSEPLPWKDGAAHVVGLRRPDGTLSGPWPAIRVDECRLAVPTLDFVPDLSWDIEPPHMLFGESTRWCYPVLMTVANPSSEGRVSVEAIPYDARVYLYDNSAAPA